MDTLAILDATKEEVGPCLKLLCLVRNYASPQDLRAHRAALQYLRSIHPAVLCNPMGPLAFVPLVPQALDDCIALRHVMGFLSARLSVGLIDLHRQFAVRFDERASVAQICSLLED